MNCGGRGGRAKLTSRSLDGGTPFRRRRLVVTSNVGSDILWRSQMIKLQEAVPRTGCRHDTGHSCDGSGGQAATRHAGRSPSKVHGTSQEGYGVKATNWSWLTITETGFTGRHASARLRQRRGMMAPTAPLASLSANGDDALAPEAMVRKIFRRRSCQGQSHEAGDGSRSLTRSIISCQSVNPDPRRFVPSP